MTSFSVDDEMTSEASGETAACAGLVQSDDVQEIDEARQAIERRRQQKRLLRRPTKPRLHSSTAPEACTSTAKLGKRTPRTGFEVLSEPKYAEADEEVGDDWFQLETGDQNGAGARSRRAHMSDKVSLYVSRGGKHVRSGAKRIGTIMHRPSQPPSVLESNTTADQEGVVFPLEAFLQSPEASTDDLALERQDTVESSLSRLPAGSIFEQDEDQQDDDEEPLGLRKSRLSRVSTYQNDDYEKMPRAMTLTFDDDDDDEQDPVNRRKSKMRSSKRSQLSRSTTRAKAKLRPSELQRKLLSSSTKASNAVKRTILSKSGLDALDVALGAALVKSGLAVEEKETVQYDVLYEHQRGMVVFGTPVFSSAALFQLDPSAWTDARFKNSPYTRLSHPLPNPYWHWLSPTWMVEMHGDTDEHGWQYAVNFGSKRWRGEPDFWWRSFVRRRRWIRARIYKPRQFAPAVVDLLKQQQKEASEDRRSLNWSNNQGQEEEDDDEEQKQRMIRQLVSSADSMEPVDPRNPFLRWQDVKRRANPRRSLTQSNITMARSTSRDGADDDGEDGPAWRDAVVEANYRRVARIMRDSVLDRQKLACWKTWLSSTTQSRPQSTVASPVLESSQISSVDFADKDRKADEDASNDDVWDLVERRLDDVLKWFEFQATRVAFLEIVSRSHASTHPTHKYQGWDRSSRVLPEQIAKLVKEYGVTDQDPQVAFLSDVVVPK